MRHIDKANRCTAFDDFVARAQHFLQNDWKKFNKVQGYKEVSLALHQHLWQDQKSLCVYCEQQMQKKLELSADAPTHFEHIRPKDKYKDLTYSFENLVVSCNGFDLTVTIHKTKQFCGHFKLEKYDDVLFLNPVEVDDIDTYFIYDSDGNIEPNIAKTPQEQQKAAYTIKTLGLNHPTLQKMRRYQITVWGEKLASDGIENIIEILQSDQHPLPHFITALKQTYI